MHPSHEGLAALPYFDEFDLSTVDVLLISQYVITFTFVLHENRYFGVTAAKGPVSKPSRISMKCAFYHTNFNAIILSIRLARRRNGLEAHKQSSISVIFEMFIEPKLLYIRNSIASKLSLPLLNVLRSIVIM